MAEPETVRRSMVPADAALVLFVNPLRARGINLRGMWWRVGVAVLVGGLLLASTERPRRAQVSNGLWVANSGAQIIAGWLLSAIFVAGVIGLLRND